MRARLRRSLIQLGSLLAVALVVVGVFAMFSVWSLNRAHMASNEETSRFLYALDDGRTAQTRFKIQVQEWKNILLRGADGTDLQRHLTAFGLEEARVQQHLLSLSERAEALGMPDMSATARRLAGEHKALGQSYRAALGKGREGTWDPFAVDRAVRGIDRPLNEALDGVAATLLAETGRRRTDAAARETRRYHTLRGFMGWSVAAAIAMVGLVLWTALRRRTGQA